MSGNLKERLAKSRPGTFFIYGPPGVGKTELSAAFPDPLFIIDPQEDGVQDLVEFGFINVVDILVAESFTQFKDLLVKAKDMACKTVVIETLAGWEGLMHNWAFETMSYKSWDKFTLFNDGPRACAREVRNIIDLLQTLRSSGKTIVMTGHSKEKAYRNPVGPDYDRIIPESNKESWVPLAKWFQNIFFMSLDYTVDESSNITERPKASSCGDRVLHTASHPAFEAKNRYRLPELIELGGSGAEGFEALAKAIKEARK